MSFSNAERVAKHKCENDFVFFIRYFFKKRFGFKFILNSHHIEICNALVRVFRGEINRLIINVPPRYGKTEIAVINFIAYCLAVNPKSKFIHLSYSDGLVLDNSSKIRDLVSSEEYQHFWPIDFSADSNAKNKWYTAQSGGIYCTSTGGAITGFGAGSTVDTGEFEGAIIIDDPLKPRDAFSDKVRTDINELMNNTIKSRLNNRKTPIIVIMQRLHDDDMSGYLLGGGTGEEWHHVKIAARRPDGSAIWPYKHTEEELNTMEAADNYAFNGQYQQAPVPDDGIFFKKDKFSYYSDYELPKNLTYYISSDYAVTDGGGDFTEHAVFGVCPSGMIYVVDWWSGQTDSDVWIEELINLIKKYRPKMCIGETGPIKRSIEPFLKKRMLEEKAFSVLEWLPHSEADKQAHARSFQAIFNLARVKFPITSPFLSDLVYQLTRFPLCKFDDKVDACSLFARKIHEIWSYCQTNDKEKNRRPDRYRDEKESSSSEYFDDWE